MNWGSTNKMQEKKSQTNQHEVTCPSCAGNLTFLPGSKSVKCDYCGTVIEIEDANTPPFEIKELDFEEYVSNNKGSAETQTIHTTRCESCGAHVNFDPNVISDRCPFCDSVMVIKDTLSETQIKPESILPFKITKNEAFTNYKNWLKKLWFAPNKLAQNATNSEGINGIYTPYWTYDAHTYTEYRGRRGDNYHEQETYTVFENGKSTTKTRTVTKTRWTNVSGSVNELFDDELVLASKSLPVKYANQLEPWDLQNAILYNEMYLSGFRTETYQIDIKEGFEIAKERMDNKIEALIKRQIGGDLQIITAKETNFNNVTFKHILLPIYISTFRYNGKAYRFLINGRTGEVQGERPYSKSKIIMLCLLIIAIILATVYLFRNTNDSKTSYSTAYSQIICNTH